MMKNSGIFGDRRGGSSVDGRIRRELEPIPSAARVALDRGAMYDNDLGDNVIRSAIPGQAAIEVQFLLLPRWHVKPGKPEH